MSRLLLCPPDHYAVRYEINPWMNRAVAVDHKLAVRQWRNLHDTLLALGCQIELITPQPEWPDMVFTANAGLMVGSRFVRANFRHVERAGEAPWFAQWFEDNGVEVLHVPDGVAFEGEGDALWESDVLFCGQAFRTDARAHALLADFLECPVVSLKLADPRFYHLDTCFCPLDEGAAAWYPAAFDEASQHLVRGHLTDLIEVHADEAEHFGCNAIVVGQEIVLPEGCPHLRAELGARGFHTHAVAMTEFMKAGGACKCLVLGLGPT
jgi:N-dimethylarginine dimethylaminohydrolase